MDWMAMHWRYLSANQEPRLLQWLWWTVQTSGLDVLQQIIVNIHSVWLTIGCVANAWEEHFFFSLLRRLKINQQNILFFHWVCCTPECGVASKAVTSEKSDCCSCIRQLTNVRRIQATAFVRPTSHWLCVYEASLHVRYVCVIWLVLFIC